MFSHLFDHLEGRLKVSLIINRIKTTKDINPHLGRLLHKRLHQVIRMVPIGHQVLAPKKHLKGGLGHQLL
jgi:hypothetical protein